jgi:hypothetical protein
LRNATAQIGTDCPADTSVAYWHFVVAPGGNVYSFVTITLNVAGTAYVFSGFPPIIANGNQTDNVFVAVPAGRQLADLQTSGSFAIVTPDAPPPNSFNLSHVCPAGEGTTTPTGSPSATTGDPSPTNAPAGASSSAPNPTATPIPTSTSGVSPEAVDGETTPATQLPGAVVTTAPAVGSTTTAAVTGESHVVLPVDAIAGLLVFAGIVLAVLSQGSI